MKLRLPTGPPRRRRLRRAPLVLATMLFAAGATLALAAPAQAQIGIVQEINNLNSGGKCIDVATENNVKVQIWSCSGGPEQNWIYASPTFARTTGPYEITNWHTATCLDAGNSFTAGTAVTMKPCTGSSTQLWQPSTTGNTASLHNVLSGLCLDLRSDNTSNGTIIQQYTCNLTAAQFWYRASGWGP